VEAAAQSRVGGSPHDTTASLIGSEFILPAQFFGGAVNGARIETDDSPEHRLMFAVLEAGIATYQRYALWGKGHSKESHLFQEVERWVLSEDTTWLYAFERICITLDLNADYLRGGLERWREHAVHAGYITTPRRVVSKRTRVVQSKTQITPRRDRRRKRRAASS